MAVSTDHEGARSRLVRDLTAPAAVVRAAWPRSRAGRRLALLASPVLLLFVLAALYVLGVVVYSLVAALGVEPVDLEESYRRVRDAVLFVGTGILTLLVVVGGGSLLRSALDRRGGPPSLRRPPGAPEAGRPARRRSGDVGRPGRDRGVVEASSRRR